MLVVKKNLKNIIKYKVNGKFPIYALVYLFIYLSQ